MRGMIGYFQDSITELRHVSWPSRRQVIQHTAVIIASVAIAMVIIAALDYGLDLLVQEFIIK